jgi:hypothetical protein
MGVPPALPGRQQKFDISGGRHRRAIDETPNREQPSTGRGVPSMDDYESLSHSKWECKYHVVFIPKCRRKTLRREEAEFCGPALLGEGILRIHSTTGHRGDTRVHQETGRRGQTSGADESVALIATFRWPTRSGAASAAPSAALSGSQPKAPGFAGGYLLLDLLAPFQPRVIRLGMDCNGTP